MKRTHLPFRIGIAVLVVTSVLHSCQSAPEEIPDDLSNAQMFQRAQEEVDGENYEFALRYYREFIRRNPDDRAGIIEAEYEIAYIAYKQEEYDTAERRFEALLAQYESDQASALPEWPKVLATKLLDKIEEWRMAAEDPLIRTNANTEPDAE